MKAYACFLIMMFCLAGLFGCKSTKTSAGKNSGNALQQLSTGTFDADANKIVFLTMEVTLSDGAGDVYSFKEVSKTFADGVLKKNIIGQNEAPENGYFYCRFFDNNRQLIDEIKTQDPLNKIYEYPSDGSIAMGKALVKSQSGQLFLRFQYNNNAKYLTIYKFSSLTKSLKKIYDAELLP